MVFLKLTTEKFLVFCLIEIFYFLRSALRREFFVFLGDLDFFLNLGTLEIAYEVVSICEAISLYWIVAFGIFFMEIVFATRF